MFPDAAFALKIFGALSPVTVTLEVETNRFTANLVLGQFIKIGVEAETNVQCSSRRSTIQTMAQ